MDALFRLVKAEPADADELIRCPVLVVGSGVAGLTVALRLSELADVTVVTKQELRDTSTEYAQGGVACVWSSEDSFDLHIADTLTAGDGLCSEEAVEVLVHEGPESVKRLIELGADFDVREGKLDLTREAAHSRRRILHARGDATGAEIEATLARSARKKPSVHLREYEFLLQLLVHNERIVGALTLQQQTGKLICYLTHTLVLCTGGLGQVYTYTTNPRVATGDGLAAAWRAGAELADMEFIQFHPTALEAPSDSGRVWLISESVRGEGALLVNCKGERFMPHYHPEAELAPRDVVARALVMEKQRTGCEHVYLDMRTMEGDLFERFPTITKACLEAGLNPAEELVPVMPVAHYMMGGIAVDLLGRSNLQGLFASGETACTGVHGANRLASNSMLEAMVFSHRIADYLRREGLPQPPAKPDTDPYVRQAPLESVSDETFAALQRHNWDRLGIIRTGEGLAAALDSLEAKAKAYCEDFRDVLALESANVALCAWIIARGALQRTESRGAHFRSDYPERDDAHWRVRQVHRLETLRKEPVTYPARGSSV